MRAQADCGKGSAVLDATIAPPAVPADVLPRPRLDALLDQSLERDVTVVTAPPGSGKTVMVAQWLGAHSAPHACWLSLASADDQPLSFWRHLLAAIERVEPAACREARQRLDQQAPAFAMETVIVLLNDLAQLDKDLVIVLDDLHELAEPSVLESVSFLIEHLPPPVHVVACSREGTPLPLHRLRVRGRLLEIGGSVLRFDHGEVEDFLRSRGWGDETERRVIEDRTEGWVAGVRLASLHPAGSGRRLASGSAIAEDAAEYLRRELILRQSDDVREFLAVISVLDEFCAPLCHAVTGRRDAGEMLRSLERWNLFLVPTADAGWFRFHHQFRDLLRDEQLGDTDVRAPEIHVAAGEWYEGEERFGPAVDHYLAAGDLERAHRLLYRRAASAGGWHDPDAVRARIDAMPAEFLGCDVDHMVRTAAILLWAGDLHEARRWLELAQARVDEHLVPTAYDAQLAAAWCWYHESRGDAHAAMIAGRRAVTWSRGQLDASDLLAQVPALLVRAHGVLGNVSAARASFARLPSMVHVSEARRGAMGRGALAWVAYEEGQLRGALDLAEGALALDDTDSVTAGFARLARGAVLAERSELATAEVELEAATEIADRRRHPVLGALARNELASLWCSAGRCDDALDLVDQARRTQPPFTLPARVSARLRLGQARILLAMGDLDRAATVGMAQTGSAQYLWRARLALAAGAHDDALRHVAAAHATGTTLRELLELAVLRAAVLLDAKHSDGPEALTRAAALAEPEGFVGVFLSLGDDFVAGVRRVVALEPSPYLYLLLSVYEDRRDRPAPDLPAVVEPMSGRERIVIRYLQGRLSNVEIARELSISTNTLKTHLKSIYRKLGATSRSEAVAQARRLQLL